MKIAWPALHARRWDVDAKDRRSRGCPSQSGIHDGGSPGHRPVSDRRVSVGDTVVANTTHSRAL